MGTTNTAQPLREINQVSGRAVVLARETLQAQRALGAADSATRTAARSRLNALDGERRQLRAEWREPAARALAGHLLRRGVDRWVALELVTAWAAQRCRPPLDADTVAHTVDSIARREAARRRAAA